MHSARQKLLSTLAQKSFRLGEFKLSSGATSDYYIDCRTTTLDANGTRLFPAVILTKLDTPDPSSPPEWDLTRAAGAYSLQIAVFKDSPERRAAAVEAVRAARAGGYDAYYYHGPTASSVCIG